MLMILAIKYGVMLFDEALPAKSQRISEIAQRDENEDLLALQSSPTQQITSPSSVLPSVQQQNPASNYHSCVLSYATNDQAFAEKLYADLQSKGISCWFAPHNLKTGDKMRAQVYEAIQKNDKLLLILSEHAITSDWVEQSEKLMQRERQPPGKLWSFFPYELMML